MKSERNLYRIVGLFSELLGVGGVQEAGRLTMAALYEIACRAGWQTTFLSLNDAPRETRLFIAGREISFRGFDRARVQFVLAALRACRKNGRIALAAHPNLAIPAALMKSVSPSMKTLVMSHGVEVWQPLPFLRRRALLGADLVLAPSRDTVQKLETVQRVPSQKIRRLPWPLSPIFLKLTESPARLPLPQAFPRGRVILTVGRWASSERYKGVDYLIRSIAQLSPTFRSVHLVAAGEGDDLPRLQTLAAELSVADRVHFLSGLSREQLAACYARADVFALPSTGEGFGLVFLEAMAFGKPVIAASTGGATDVVEHEINGLLIPPRDTQRLTEALSLLLRESELCTKLGREGVAKIYREYLFDAFVSALEGILRSCGAPIPAE